MTDTRSQLKQIATEQIRRHTLHAASFREMGKVLNIKSSSVHYHFDNREALLLELVQDYEQAFFQELEQRCMGITSPSKRLQALAETFLASYEQRYQCLCMAFIAAGDEASTDHRLAVQHVLQRLEQWLVDSLTRASLLRQPKPELAKVIISALEGALLLDRDQPEPKHLLAVSQWLKTLTSL